MEDHSVVQNEGASNGLASYSSTSSNPVASPAETISGFDRMGCDEQSKEVVSVRASAVRSVAKMAAVDDTSGDGLNTSAKRIRIEGGSRSE